MILSQAMAFSLSSKNSVATFGLLIFKNKLPIIRSYALLLYKAKAETCFVYSSEAPALLASPEISASSPPSNKT